MANDSEWFDRLESSMNNILAALKMVQEEEEGTPFPKPPQHNPAVEYFVELIRDMEMQSIQSCLEQGESFVLASQLAWEAAQQTCFYVGYLMGKANQELVICDGDIHHREEQHAHLN